MAELPIKNPPRDEGGCGTSCGAGLEKIYPATAIRYGAMRWVGEFRYRPGSVFRCGGKVVIETDRGVEIGEQVSLTCNGCSKSVSREQIKRYVEASGADFYKLRAGRILREATPQDLLEHEKLNAKLHEDIDRASLIAAQVGLEIAIVTVEHLLGGERIVFYFRHDEGRVDFRDLVKELAHYYQTRIQMVQVGARDEARLVADYEICGRECCCRNFLKKLRPVNMKMAKLQKSTLDPTKVSGRCGRLRCCLRYEHEGYEELDAKLPRAGLWVETEFGVGQIIDRQVLTQLLMIRTTEGRVVTVPAEELRAVDVAPPPPPAEGFETGYRGRRTDSLDRGRPDRRRERPPRRDEPPRRAPAGESGMADEPAPDGNEAVPDAEAPSSFEATEELAGDGGRGLDVEAGAETPPGGDAGQAGGAAEGGRRREGRRRRNRRRFRGPRRDGPGGGSAGGDAPAGGGE